MQPFNSSIIDSLWPASWKRKVPHCEPPEAMSSRVHVRTTRCSPSSTVNKTCKKFKSSDNYILNSMHSQLYFLYNTCIKNSPFTWSSNHLNTKVGGKSSSVVRLRYQAIFVQLNEGRCHWILTVFIGAISWCAWVTVNGWWS